MSLPGDKQNSQNQPFGSLFNKFEHNTSSWTKILDVQVLPAFEAQEDRD